MKKFENPEIQTVPFRVEDIMNESGIEDDTTTETNKGNGTVTPPDEF